MLGSSFGSGDNQVQFYEMQLCPAEAKELVVTDPLSTALVNLAVRIMALIPIAWC